MLLSNCSFSKFSLSTFSLGKCNWSKISFRKCSFSECSISQCYWSKFGFSEFSSGTLSLSICFVRDLVFRYLCLGDLKGSSGEPSGSSHTQSHWELILASLLRDAANQKSLARHRSWFWHHSGGTQPVLGSAQHWQRNYTMWCSFVGSVESWLRSIGSKDHKIKALYVLLSIGLE